MLIYNGKLLMVNNLIAIGLDCCCSDGPCCPNTIPVTPGITIGQQLIVFCVDPITEDTCTCTWTWNGTVWVLTGDSCND